VQESFTSENAKESKREQNRARESKREQERTRECKREHERARESNKDLFSISLLLFGISILLRDTLHVAISACSLALLRDFSKGLFNGISLLLRLLLSDKSKSLIFGIYLLLGDTAYCIWSVISSFSHLECHFFILTSQSTI